VPTVGSMKGMAQRVKTSITVDPGKLSAARELTGADSASEAIDIALTRLVRMERERRHTDAYVRHPQGDEETEWGRQGEGLDEW
jgi:Arc/MetJ family transcription regulator